MLEPGEAARWGIPTRVEAQREILGAVAGHYDADPDHAVPGWQIARKLRAVAAGLR